MNYLHAHGTNVTAFDVSSLDFIIDAQNTTGNYTFTIDGFGAGDTLDTTNATLSNTDYTDGIIDIVYGGVTIHLTGVATADDAAATSLDYFSVIPL
ncbi:MAG: hypothetical protein Q7S59_09990 [Sulfurimonas sp.]|nr:hypothetical protein [Sulfurimonas sp.]